MENNIYTLFARYKVDDTIYKDLGQANRNNEMETRLKNRRKRKKERNN